MHALKRNLWVGALAMGLLFVVLGAWFVIMGLDAKDTIRTALAEENVTTGADAVKYGVPAGVLVIDAKTAEAEAEVIKLHTYGKYGAYADMERDDPNRAAYLKGLTLRNALNMAVMGFGVADLAIGTGLVIVLMGAGTMGFLAPVLYFTTAEEREEPTVRTGAPVPMPA